MLNKSTLFTATSKSQNLPSEATHFEPLWDTLNAHGYCLLRNYAIDIPSFSHLVRRMCNTVTLDPARTSSTNAVQKVDAGTDALGLHIENGNTPNAPELVFFYCQKSPRQGSQTTLCDGVTLLANLPEELKELFSQKLYVSRTISEEHWKTYLANEHPAVESAGQVTARHLTEMLAMRDNIEGVLNADQSLTYRLSVDPVLNSNLCKQRAFANAILGPSFSYEPPVYEFKNGVVIDDQLKLQLATIAEQNTLEISWNDGDLAIIDNHRVMHGRRKITDSSSRELFIGMGNL